MRIKKYFKKITITSLFLFLLSIVSPAQTTISEPRQEKLLNGLKLLVWSDAKAQKATVKLRIHSGSAFDPLAREGVMALLADILFPSETARDYFSEDLGGSLSVTSNYDYIQIDATGDNDKILEILEALAQAVSQPQIDKETTAKVKAAKLEKIKELEKNPTYMAVQTVSKQLYGSYPYGRAPLGTSESVSKIDFADVLLAKQKFLTADNATLTISGNVKFDLIFRAARRYFGGWIKADKKVPATFTQPDAPASIGVTLDTDSSAEIADMLIAIRSFARNDKDFYASQILVKIMTSAVKNPSDYFVKSESYLLNGIFMIKGKTASEKSPKFQIGREVFEKAKAEVLAELNQRNLADFWLDGDTYKLAPVKDELNTAANIKLEDVQRVWDRLQTQPSATIIIPKTVGTNSKTN
ncbi:MAG TPA: pitrilysin family protein [Pyrinomonadaceae bacterium]|jgi:predicted Zn-dependent peptidase